MHVRTTLGTVADVLGIAGFLGALVALVSGQDLTRTVLAVYVCLLATAMLGWNVRSTARHGPRLQRVDALPRLTDAVDEVAHATRALLAGGPDAAFRASLRVALGHVAELYGVATGVPCRVTLKRTFRAQAPDGRRLAVDTLCRSSGEAGGRSRSGADWVDDNTDFRMIFHSGDPFFLCNDLAAAVGRGYRNSHFTERAVATGRFPYLSTVVWPIRGRVPGDGGGEGPWRVVGFLCVDAQQRHVFDPASDIAAGATVAHALYTGLARLHDSERHEEGDR